MMDGGTQPDSLSIDPAAVGFLMPMHLVVSPTGHIRSVGPTMMKVCRDARVIGQRFLELFELRRPRNVVTMAELVQGGAVRLSLALRMPPKTSFKGIAVPLGPGQGMLINLSFGIALGDAVRDHHLSDSDFAPTDLTVEMLYLSEAKTVVLDELHRLNQRLQGARKVAETLALTDAVTGLSNRRAMGIALDRMARTGTPFSVMTIDLDFFKQVNDTLGHAAGDFVLYQVARILCAATRGSDTAARIGGDEFVLIFPNLTDEFMLCSIAHRILSRLEEPMSFDGNPCRISASIGTTMSTQYAKADPEQMLNDADRALYASKRRGRRQVTAFTADLDQMPET